MPLLSAAPQILSGNWGGNGITRSCFPPFSPLSPRRHSRADGSRLHREPAGGGAASAAGAAAARGAGPLLPHPAGHVLAAIHPRRAGHRPLLPAAHRGRRHGRAAGRDAAGGAGLAAGAVAAAAPLSGIWDSAGLRVPLEGPWGSSCGSADFTAAPAPPPVQGVCVGEGFPALVLVFTGFAVNSRQ